MANANKDAPQSQPGQSDPSAQSNEAKNFVHLHLHSQYSLLDGGNRLDRLVKQVAELGMSAVAVTDHGNLFGAVDFYTKAKDAGIKPILGIEAYVAPQDRRSREYTGVADGGYHLVLLAENQTGWANLVKLSSDSFLQGFYFKPRMDKSTLSEHCEGVIAINGHLGSSLAALLTQYVRTNEKKYFDDAVAEAKWHKETFGTNDQGEPCFYIELQRHDIQDQLDINPHLIRIADQLDLPLVCDNDAHFLTLDDYDSHDTLCCISMGKIKTDPARLKYSRDLYVKSPQEMWDLFTDPNIEIPVERGEEALRNTVKIADRCNVDIDFSANHAPVVKIVFNGDEQIYGNCEELELPVDSDAAVAFIEKFECEHPPGSTAWYGAFCGQFKLLPFDAEHDDESEDELKARCDGALRLLTEAGAIWRYGVGGVNEARRARTERELQVLKDKDISAYFLIVWDFVNEARRRNIPVNARGSGVGTMVGFCLALSNACPIDYGLLFERFTDPDRSEYPDIDIDMCQDGRQDLIDYVRQKYGHVAQIITFNVLKAKAAVRDVGRVMDIPLSDVDKLCKLIGDGLGTTIEKALKQEPDLQKIYDENPMLRDVLDTAQRLEGMARHAGVHAAGVIVATQPLDNIVPLYKANNGKPAKSKKKNGDGDNEVVDQIVTQWDGPTCERVGLLKMDFLGLRTLSIITRAVELTKATLSDDVIRQTVPEPEVQTEGVAFDPMDLERLAFDDERVYELFARGETAGVFQFESGGMRNLLLAMVPDRLEDLIAANALYRPGPMDLIPDYNDRKHQRSAVPTVDPIVDEITRETYGIMVYQEQVMQVVNQLGGIPLRQAYTLIKAISKKKEKVINANRAEFIKGAGSHNVSESQAAELFDLILKFAGYGFNKSHSTGYAIVAYQTAYLKTYFPVQYMAALLTYESVSTEKVVEYIDECKRVMRPNGERGIEVRQPDINLSAVGFTVVFDEDEPHDANHGHIRFGLSAVKGVGKSAIEAIIVEREKAGPFTSLFDFCERVPQGSVSRSTIEALIKCGAFDEIHSIDERSAMLDVLESALRVGAQESALANSDDFLFGAVAQEDRKSTKAKQEVRHLPAIPAWSTKDTLEFEKEVLGFYVSSHPLDAHTEAIYSFSTCSITDTKELSADVPVIIGGMVATARTVVTRKGDKMAILRLEDNAAGNVECVMFPKTYAENFFHLESEDGGDPVLFVEGKVDRRREEPQIIVDRLIPINRAEAELTQAMKIVVRDPVRSNEGTSYNGELTRLREILRQASTGGSATGGAGSAKVSVLLELHQDDAVVNMRLQPRIRVDRNILDSIHTILRTPKGGEAKCVLMGPPKLNPTQANAMQPQRGRTEQPKLAMRSSQQDGSCASIDRY